MTPPATLDEPRGSCWIGTSLRSAVLGIGLGSLAGAVELALLLRPDPAAWDGLAQARLLIVGVYALAGAAVALVCHGLVRWLAPASGGSREVALLAALALGGGFGLLHANYRWLGDPAAASSVLFDLALALVLGAAAAAILRSARRRRPRSASDRWLVAASALGATVALLSFAVAAWTERGGESARSVVVVPGGGDWSTPGPASLALDPPLDTGPGTAAAGPPRLIFLGIDGATWSLLLPLLEQGLLPNIEALVREGVSGVLISHFPVSSPVVWTTIMTGKTPVKHGISSQWLARSSNRRARPLWSIVAERFGRPVLVANVPGTYPAERAPGVLFAGFPTVLESLTNVGVFRSTRPADAFATASQALRLERGEGRRRGWLDIADQSLAEMQTALGILHGKIGGQQDPLLGGLAVKRYAVLRFEERGDRLAFFLGEPEAEAFSIAEGEWSPWLVVGDRLALRVHLVERGPEHLTVYVTPLWPIETRGRVEPPEVGRALQTRLGPYIIEGVGIAAMREPRVMRPLASLLVGIERERFRFVDSLWRHPRWSALFYVVTLTDRASHAYWSFLSPARFPAIDAPTPYPGALTADTRAELAEVIPLSYRVADAIVGRVLERATADTLVVLASDHGFRTWESQIPGWGSHDLDGIYVLRGGAIPVRRDAGAGIGPSGPTLQSVDLMPTVLAALGLPVASDLDGTVAEFVRTALAADGVPLAAVPSFEEEGQGRRPVEIDETMLEQLRSIGYVD